MYLYTPIIHYRKTGNKKASKKDQFQIGAEVVDKQQQLKVVAPPSPDLDQSITPNHPSPEEMSKFLEEEYRAGRHVTLLGNAMVDDLRMLYEGLLSGRPREEIIRLAKTA